MAESEKVWPELLEERSECVSVCRAESQSIYP